MDHYGPPNTSPYSPPFGDAPYAPACAPYAAAEYCSRGIGWESATSTSEAIPELGRPLRVGHVGQFLMRGGIEMWLKGLIRHSRPERMRFVRCVATSNVYWDQRVAAELGIPVEIGGRDSVRRLAADCDVLLCSGPAETAEWLADLRPKLTVFIAHGDAPPYRALLQRCGSIIDHVVAVSSRVRARICANFPCTVIPNGIDVAHVAPSRSQAEVREALGFGPKDFVLGYVGRFSLGEAAGHSH